MLYNYKSLAMNRNMPSIYLLYIGYLSFIKNPIGFRYITSGKYTYINGLSKKLSACLKSF